MSTDMEHASQTRSSMDFLACEVLLAGWFTVPASEAGLLCPGCFFVRRSSEGNLRCPLSDEQGHLQYLS